MEFEREIRNVGDGWKPIVQEVHDKLLALDPEYRIVQVKEKFGGLRFYFMPASPDSEAYKEMRDIVDEAEARSYSVCEECGNFGECGNSRESGGSSWLRTLCDTCRQTWDRDWKAR